jgi:glutaredoxin-like YruB-family protein
MQPPFREQKGVIRVVSGYAGGAKPNPTYEEVSTGTTGHLEAVQVTYDPDVVSYDQLLEVFWRQIDPTDPEGQFADKGSQYRTAIFYHDDEQKRLAEISLQKINASGRFEKPVATQIRPFVNFWPAEEYHQDYDKKQPGRYRDYKKYSGREGFISRVWGKPASRVKIFATPHCTGCRAVKEFLTSQNIPFEEIDMAADEAARDYVKEKTGQISSPIVQVGDEFVVGFNRQKLESLLAHGSRPGE